MRDWGGRERGQQQQRRARATRFLSNDNCSRTPTSNPHLGAPVKRQRAACVYDDDEEDDAHPQLHQLARMGRVAATTTVMRSSDDDDNNNSNIVYTEEPGRRRRDGMPFRNNHDCMCLATGGGSYWQTIQLPYD